MIKLIKIGILMQLINILKVFTSCKSSFVIESHFSLPTYYRESFNVMVALHIVKNHIREVT